MTGNYEERSRQDARLAILAELAAQRDATLNSLSLHRMLAPAFPRRLPEWVESQIDWLDAVGAVNATRTTLAGLGEVLVAELTRTGRNHVERLALISGVSRPADAE